MTTMMTTREVRLVRVERRLGRHVELPAPSKGREPLWPTYTSNRDQSTVGAARAEREEPPGVDEFFELTFSSGEVPDVW